MKIVSWFNSVADADFGDVASLACDAAKPNHKVAVISNPFPALSGEQVIVVYEGEGTDEDVVQALKTELN